MLCTLHGRIAWSRWVLPTPMKQMHFSKRPPQRYRIEQRDVKVKNIFNSVVIGQWTNFANNSVFLFIFFCIRPNPDRKSRKFSPNHTSQPNDENDSTVVLRNNPISTPIHQFNHIPQPTALSGANNVLKDKKRSNRKLTKADISMPTNFKHVVHVGWSAQKGFDLKGDEVSSLNAFLEKAGVSEQQLNDRETRDFIYDFIQCNNVLDSVKSETEVPPPPVPSRHVSVNIRIPQSGWQQDHLWHDDWFIAYFLILHYRMVRRDMRRHRRQHQMQPGCHLAQLGNTRNQDCNNSVDRHQADRRR